VKILYHNINFRDRILLEEEGKEGGGGEGDYLGLEKERIEYFSLPESRFIQERRRRKRERRTGLGGPLSGVL